MTAKIKIFVQNLKFCPNTKSKNDYSIRLCLELELKEKVSAIVETASYESMLS